MNTALTYSFGAEEDIKPYPCVDVAATLRDHLIGVDRVPGCGVLAKSELGPNDICPLPMSFSRRLDEDGIVGPVAADILGIERDRALPLWPPRTRAIEVMNWWPGGEEFEPPPTG